MIEEKKPTLLKDVAYEKIKEYILEDYFQSDQMVSERELINLLEMSKTPIKSALIRLESEGFLKVSSKQGIIIHDLSLDKIVDIYNMRTALESFVVEQISGRLTDEQVKNLQANLEDAKECVDRLDEKWFTKLDHDFHLMLAESYGNKEIQRILLNYNEHLRRITNRHLRKDNQRMKVFHEEHVEIFNQLVDGSNGVGKLMKDHLQKSKEALFN